MILSLMLLVDIVFQRMRDQDWSGVFLWLLLVLLPSGITIFFVHDRYYRRRGLEPIQLTVKGN